MDSGIVGNCQFNGLIDRTGEVNWLCWPRFDSSFVFGTLLDSEKGGRFSIGTVDGTVGQQNYIYNTNILRTVFECSSGKFEVIDFAPRFRQYERYFKPTMLIRIVRPLKGEPMGRVVCQPTYDYGRMQLKAIQGSNHIDFDGAEQLLRLTTNASLTMVLEGRPFAIDQTYYFCLTWGKPLEEDLEHTCRTFLEKTKSYWQRWVKHCFIPREFQDQVIRSALVLKLHQFEDTGAIIASSTTSLPEEQGSGRNWDYRYCWLRDAQFSLHALQRLTQFEEMEGFVKYLINIIEFSNDRLQPVYGVSGEARLIEQHLGHLAGFRGNQPVRIGNQAYEHLQHDVYGEMILAIGQLFTDRRFNEHPRNGPRMQLEKLLKRIEQFLDAEDAGLWEFRGIAQLHTFTVLMHWVGARSALIIGRELGDEGLVGRATQIMHKAQHVLDSRCWSNKLKLYTQAADCDQLDASLLMLINLGYMDHNHPHAHAQVDAIARQLMAPKGLIHRYIHEDDFGQSRNVFTICCFWLAEAYARLQRKEEARAIFETLLQAANHVGLYSEDLHPETLEQWGNFPQTYSHVGLINAAFVISEPWDL